MILDLKHKILLATILLCLIGLVAGAKFWIDEHDARVLLSAQLKADGEARQKIDAHEAIVRAETDAQIKSVRDEAARQKTPQQIAQWIPQQLPGLPTPITVNIPPSVQGQLPPPATATIPQEDLVAIRNLISECQVCKAERTQAQSNLEDERAKNKSLSGDLDTAKKVAKGGGFWKRTGRAAKWIVIGIAVGYGLHR